MNSSESEHPLAFHDDDGKYYLFYQGNNDNGETGNFHAENFIMKTV